MKIFKFIVSFLLILGIFVLLIWAGIKSNNKTCTDISIVIRGVSEPALLSESDILSILKQNNIKWKEEQLKEIDCAGINKILSKENYIESVDKVHFLGTKLQIEVTLHKILLEIEPQNGQKFLLDMDGIYLPYSPNIGNDVIVATGKIPYSFHHKKKIIEDDTELHELYTVAVLIKQNPFYAELFKKMIVNDKHEIILCPSVGNLSVLLGTAEVAEEKLETLKYMYDDVLPYMDENKYAQLDVRFAHRIVATKKNKS